MSEPSSESAALFWFLFWFAVWAIFASIALARDGDGSSVGEASQRPSSIREWLDQKAAIAISRRPQVRKRRHRHHHHAHDGSAA